MSSAGASVSPTEDRLTPSYFAAALENDEVVGDRKVMLRCFEEDAAAWAARLNEKVEPHVSYGPEQHTTLRLMTWNINNLCGVRWDGAVTASQLMETILSVNPDVVCLQETTVDGTPYTDPHFETACTRVVELDAALEAAGFTVHRGVAGNPPTCGSRLPVLHTESIDLDRAHQWRERVKTHIGKLTRDADGEITTKGLAQNRAALHLELDLTAGGGVRGDSEATSIDVFNAHLHHANYTPTAEGIRAAEMAELLSRVAQRERPSPAVIAGDFNQCREKDFEHNSAGWKIVSQALAKFDGPVDDGVSGALEGAGFTACWDAAATRNYGDGPPPGTHWTGTTVDYVYLAGKNGVFQSANVLGSGLSDHLPVVVDIALSSDT